MTERFEQDKYLERKSDIHQTKLNKSVEKKKLLDGCFYKIHVFNVRTKNLALPSTKTCLQHFRKNDLMQMNEI